MSPLGIRPSYLSVCIAALGFVPPVLAQTAAPLADRHLAARSEAATLALLGEELLENEDPVRAHETFRTLRSLDPAEVSAWIGLGRAELLLGRPARALAHANRALALDPLDDGAIELKVRALIRDRRFDEAVAFSTRAVAADRGGPGTLAAHASALFRIQRNDEAASFYRSVLDAEPDHAEAHLRLGSGLTSPRAVVPAPALRDAVGFLRAGRLDAGVDRLRAVLHADPGNPVAHRLLGEALFQTRARHSMACCAPEFARVAELLPEPQVDARIAALFMPDFPGLTGERREVAERALAVFGSRIPELIRKGGGHDLLAEAERTTDAASRASLRGRRTFDGRVWDDVRGIGGLRAATGIEALDEASTFGFDTLVHEIAHQVHLYGFDRRSVQVRIRRLYQRAVDEGRCLDYYAATNYAEYFGQGVEAFVSLVKRPAVEATHAHTRFELMRVDPELHALIAELVDFDPLDAGGAERREALLAACIDAALRAGRVEDARTAAGMLPVGSVRETALARAGTLAASLDVE